MTHLQETARNAHSELDADIVFRSLAKFKTEVEKQPDFGDGKCFHSYLYIGSIENPGTKHNFGPVP